MSVHFRLINADVEQNNVKGDRKFFLPRVAEMEWAPDSLDITIPFEYRPLSGSEIIAYRKKNQQEAHSRSNHLRSLETVAWQFPGNGGSDG